MLKSPLRITVVILAALAGFVLDRIVVQGAILPAILVGLVVAMCIPTKRACRVSFQQK